MADNTVKVSTKLYTKLGYEIIRHALHHEYIGGSRHIQPGGGFVFVWPVYYIHGWYVPCLTDNYANIEPDGEVTFSVKWFSGIRVKSISNAKVVNLIMRDSRNARTYFPQNSIENYVEGVELICKHLRGKCTEEDKKSPLYARFIGQPLDPFRSALLQMKKEQVNSTIEKYRGNDFTIPDDYKPNDILRVGQYVGEKCTEAFDEYLNCLNTEVEA